MQSKVKQLPPALKAVLPKELIDSEKLLLALTHRSITGEESVFSSNERLEFLGDSVLSAIVSEFLYFTYPDWDEGRLSKLRAAVVNARSLAEIAAAIGVDEAVVLSKAEEASSGRSKPSILADCLEAIIGASWLQCGPSNTTAWVLSLIVPQISERVTDNDLGDYKSVLQEELAHMGEDPPVYEVSWEGPDHARIYSVSVIVGGKVLGSGEGNSKKDAQQSAAKQALVYVGKLPPTGLAE